MSGVTAAEAYFCSPGTVGVLLLMVSSMFPSADQIVSTGVQRACGPLHLS